MSAVHWLLVGWQTKWYGMDGSYGGRLRAHCCRLPCFPFFPPLWFLLSGNIYERSTLNSMLHTVGCGQHTIKIICAYRLHTPVGPAIPTSWSRYFEEDLSIFPIIVHDLAQVAAWDLYNLRDLTHVHSIIACSVGCASDICTVQILHNFSQRQVRNYSPDDLLQYFEVDDY